MEVLRQGVMAEGTCKNAYHDSSLDVLLSHE